MLELFDRLRTMIDERKSADLLRTHLELVQSEFAALKEKLGSLDQAFAKSEAENHRLRAELAAKTRAEEFHHVADMLFLRDRNGGHLKLPPYCPTCHKPLSYITYDFGYRCPACKFTSRTEARHVEGLLAAYKG